MSPSHFFFTTYASSTDTLGPCPEKICIWGLRSSYSQISLLSYILLYLILYVPVNNFSVMSGWVFLGLTTTKQWLMCLAQGHNAMTLVRLKPATPQSGNKHSTTEPLRSHIAQLQRLAKMLKSLHVARLDNTYSWERITKVLIRLHRCAGWSASLLFAYNSKIFSQQGPIKFTNSLHSG